MEEGQKTFSPWMRGEVQDIEEAAHVEVPGFFGVLFAGGGEHGGEEVHLPDLLLCDDGLQELLIQHIEGYKAGVVIPGADV